MRQAEQIFVHRRRALPVERLHIAAHGHPSLRRLTPVSCEKSGRRYRLKRYICVNSKHGAFSSEKAPCKAHRSVFSVRVEEYGVRPGAAALGVRHDGADIAGVHVDLDFGLSDGRFAFCGLDHAVGHV